MEENKNEFKKLELDINTIVDNIHYYAKVKKLKLKDVEEKCGVSAGYFSRLRNETKSPSIKIICDVCNVLEITFQELIEEKHKLQLKEEFDLELKRILTIAKHDRETKIQVLDYISKIEKELIKE